LENKKVKNVKSEKMKKNVKTFFTSLEWTELHQSVQAIHSLISQTRRSWNPLKFLTRCSVSRRGRLTGEKCRESMQNFAVFNPVQFRGWIRSAKRLSQFLQFQPRTEPQIYLWRAAAARAGRLRV